MTANDRRPENRWRPPTHHVRVCLLKDCAAQDDELMRALEQRLGISISNRGNQFLLSGPAVNVASAKQLLIHRCGQHRDALLGAIGGMIMSGIDMVNRYKAEGRTLDEAAIRHELEGNICRCTGYHNIVKAIGDAAAKM